LARLLLLPPLRLRWWPPEAAVEELRGFSGGGGPARPVASREPSAS